MKKMISWISALSVAFILVSCDAMLPVINNLPQPNTGPNYGNNTTTEGYFAGNYTNEADTNRYSNFTISLNQSGTHVSGTSRNSSADGNDSGLLSVDGYVDGNVANIQFFDQRGNMIASGVLSHNNGAFSFIQNSSSSFIPRESYLLRGGR